MFHIKERSRRPRAMQNKKLLVVAVGAALTIPSAYAAKNTDRPDVASDPDAVVELYGRIYPEMIREYGKDPTPGGTHPAPIAAAPATGTKSIITRNEMESSNSRLGVRGQEKLGEGLKAIF